LDEHAQVTPGNRIKAILHAALAPVSIEVIDESYKHASHPHTIKRTSTDTTSNGTHFHIRIVSEAFSGKSRVERHRAINHLLRAEFEQGLHALVIEAQAPGE
jgi:BolA family transcriptional regulator, general stress-responsive regulator